MKTSIIIILVISTIVLANCKTSSQSNSKSETLAKTEIKNTPVVAPYDLPYDSATMTEAQKAEFISFYEKGIIVYNTICAKCHNKIVNGEAVVPDFSLPQLMDYEVRIQYPSHGDHLKESNLSALELDYVVHYLRYKKKSGVHF
ncbi:MAG: hypothetical protein V4620_13400 [Bacteroidota bacterium]